MKVINVELSTNGMWEIIKEQNGYELDREFLDCLWEYAIFHKTINRTFVSCPFCNGDNSFQKIHTLAGSKPCKIWYNYKGTVIKVGNSMMFIVSQDEKVLYKVPDLYFHFFFEHHMLPKEDFKSAVIHGIKPGSKKYFDLIKEEFLSDKEKELIQKGRFMVSDINCSTCKKVLQGKMAYKICEKYNQEICSYFDDSSSMLEGNYKYICYRCGHYV